MQRRKFQEAKTYELKLDKDKISKGKLEKLKRDISELKGLNSKEGE